MFLALAQLTNKAFTDAGKGRIRQSLTALVSYFIADIYLLCQGLRALLHLVDISDDKYVLHCILYLVYSLFYCVNLLNENKCRFIGSCLKYPGSGIK